MNIDKELSTSVYSCHLTTENKDNVSLPYEIFRLVFDNFEFSDLMTHREYKIKVLKEALTGEEVLYRLRHKSGSFVIGESNYCPLVNQVYKIALCCKAFCQITFEKRLLLYNAKFVDQDGCNGFMKDMRLKGPNFEIKEKYNPFSFTKDLLKEIDSITSKADVMSPDIRRIVEKQIFDLQAALQQLLHRPPSRFSLHYLETIPPLNLVLRDPDEEEEEKKSEEEEKSVPPSSGWGCVIQ